MSILAEGWGFDTRPQTNEKQSEYSGSAQQHEPNTKRLSASSINAVDGTGDSTKRHRGA